MSGNGSAVQAIKVSNSAVSTISSNIANSSSNVYKEITTQFKTLVTQGKPYGVVTEDQQSVTRMGAVNNTGNATDLSISGNGLFVVDLGGSLYYTRNGDFSLDKDLILRNSDNVTLKVWNYSENENYVPSPDQLIEASFTDLGVEASPTTMITMDLNLKADQDILGGYGSIIDYNSLANEDIEREDIIVPDNTIFAGDGMIIETESGQRTEVFYGGIATSKKIDNLVTNGILGTMNENSTFTGAVEGDSFTLSTITLGDLTFTFNENNPDVTYNKFNSLSTLAEAINYNEGISARIDNGQLYISAINANDSITFKNIVSNLYQTGNLNGIYGQDNPRSQLLSYGASALSVPDENTNLAFTNGSDLSIKLSNGYTNTYIYNSAPSAPNEFSTLQDFANAINSSTDLIATINNPGTSNANLTVDLVNPDVVFMNVESTGSTDIARFMGISINSTFKKNIMSGDSIDVEVGSFNNVSTIGNINSSALLSEIEEINSYDAFSIPKLGVTTSTDIFDIADGSTIEITITDLTSGASNTNNLIFNANGSEDFTNLTELVSSVTGLTNLTSSLTGGIVNITADTGFSVGIRDISGNLADLLGLEAQPLADGENLTIQWNNGKSAVFTFRSIGPDVANNEFSTMSELSDLINNINGATSNFVGERMILSPAEDMGSSIANSSGIVADKLKIGVNTQNISLIFNANSPDVAVGEFNDVMTFAEAVNNISNGLLEGTVAGNGQTVSFSTKHNGSISFIKDVNITGNSNIASKFGLIGSDLVSAIGLESVASGFDRFSTATGLKHVINSSGAGINSEFSRNTVEIANDDITKSLNFSNSSNNDLVNFLGLPSVQEAGYSVQDSSKNMASGKIEPNFEYQMKIYDALGIMHDVSVGFLKTDINTWALEVYTKYPDEIRTNRNDGLLAFGGLEFNGNGSLYDISFQSISNIVDNTDDIYDFQIDWVSGATPSVIALDFGEYENSTRPTSVDLEQRSVLRQFSGEYTVRDFSQDGYPVGNMRDIFIDHEGTISVNFSNGTSRPVYKIPVALFEDANQLFLQTGSLYTNTLQSGTAMLSQPGTGKAGFLLNYSLEGSNVDISYQMLQLIQQKQLNIMAVKAYSTGNSMVDELVNI
ncbi:MAG: hypothetical protein P857_941 [Candidatus Xenolissoclinum pacificiensis L6]|uniref:Flagellar hook protein FlgE n=1 Tax=Candidatus Xenolissoclinum pacificiensis L6 TaxID=1401685 RepID=W2V039_9RICK|nr:MAG: hypothetical protein P857_941 [Candidatus Xenolissoclinum pacificiensis L6]